MSFCVYTILYTLEDKKPEENEYVPMFLLWMAQLAKIGTATTITILVDSRTKKYLNDDTSFPVLYARIESNIVLIEFAPPKTHMEGMRMKYYEFDYEEDYLMYLDIDVLVLKPLSGLLKDSKDLYLHAEGAIEEHGYLDAVNEEEKQNILESGLKCGYSAGKFIIGNKEKGRALFKEIRAFIIDNPETNYYSVEQPIFNRTVIFMGSYLDIGIIDKSLISTNFHNYSDDTTILIDSCGEPGNGRRHLFKMINVVTYENISKSNIDNGYFMNLINVMRNVYNSREMFSDETGYCHYLRTILDVNVFSYLKYSYGNMLNEFWNNCAIPRESDRAIIFVERRCHVNLEFCIKNAAYFARGYAIHIFCSDANLEFVKKICGNNLNNIHIHVQFKGFGTPVEGRTEYNELLKRRKFWEIFTEEHLLIFETDCYLIKPIPDSIYEYDYVTSQWSWLPEEPGGGGLSYRKRSLMLEIVAKFDPSFATFQDCFVNSAIKTLPNRKWTNDYFIESCDITEKTIGVHQWWTFTRESHFSNLEKYITFAQVC